MEFPELHRHSRRKNRTVHAALLNDTWILDLAHGNTQQLWPEVIRLNRWLISKNLSLNDQVRDKIQWKHTASGSFSTSSAYSCQFQGMVKTNFRKMPWQAWAPARLKFMVWLLLKNRLWCNDRLQRRGWPNEYFCQFCFRNLETSHHLFWQCPFSSAIWARTAQGNGCNSLHPTVWQHKNKAVEIIAEMLNGARPEHKKGVKTMIILVLGDIWQQRNECIFRHKIANQTETIASIRRNVELWRQAGATHLEHPFWDPP
jgi:hypothetical protein